MSTASDKSVFAVVRRWFTAPEPNAAGRMGLFRILYALFYLWHLSPAFIGNLHGLPPSFYNRVLLTSVLPPAKMPLWALELAEGALIAALVLLLFGLGTRVATLTVLVLGSLYEAWLTALDAEHSTVLLAFYIPLFMLIAGNWGDCYSIDALLRRRRGLPAVDPDGDSWRYFLPARAVLIVMGVLFLSSAVFKLALGGTWLHRPDLLANIMLDKNVKAAVRELPVNPLAPLIAQRAWLHVPLQGFLLAFEAGFILALLGRRIRNLILSTALFFHAINALWLVVTFTPILIAYGLFVDWQKLRQRLLPGSSVLRVRVPSGAVVILALVSAIATGLLWNTGMGLRSAINFGGQLDWRTIWYFVLPLAIIWWARSVWQIVVPAGAGRADGRAQDAFDGRASASSLDARTQPR